MSYLDLINKVYLHQSTELNYMAYQNRSWRSGGLGAIISRDVIRHGNIFPRHMPFVSRIHLSPQDSPHKEQ